jgi:tRNA-dihydrouridine synthase
MFLEECRHPVVYNGDIFSVQDFVRIRDRFPDCERVMLGRGLIANPALARETGGGARLEKEELRKFHDAVFEALRETLPGQAPLIGKMKELWFYMGRNFEGADRYLKDIRKAKDLVRYRAAVRTLFSQCVFKD